MSLKKGVGAALWALRTQRHISQGDLGNALSQKQVYLVEHGESTLTIGKLEELSRALGVHPVTLIALSASAQENVPAKKILENALQEIDDFERAEGTELLRQHFSGEASERKAKESEAKLHAVHACRERGLTQSQTAIQLGMAKSTVRYFWNKPTVIQ